MTELIENAQLVWDRLVREEALRADDYDRDLIDQLRGDLGLARSADFRAALVDVSADTFVRALLRAVAPFSRMMVELLALCERIQARRGGAANLTVRFNFDETEDELDIDLTKFRETVARFRRVVVARQTRVCDESALLDISELVDELLDELRAGASALPSREVRDSWPPLKAPAPVSGAAPLDKILAALWDLRDDFIIDASARWPDRYDSLRRPDKDDPDISVASDAGETVAQLWVLVSDFWDHGIGARIAGIARAVGSLPQPLSVDVTEAITDFTRRIRGYLAKLPMAEQLVERDIEELVDVLSLPLWGKRYELYSAWVFPRIVDAIGFDRLKFRLPQGRLSFDFRGSRLATFDTVDGFADVWAELRTAYRAAESGKALLGKSRINSVQPDYSVAFDIEKTNAAIFLAVECKQYLRRSSNHAKALHDYTMAMPNAAVVLAAHGPVSKTVTRRVDPASRVRAHAVGHLRPGREMELVTFANIVSAAIPPPPAKVRRAPDTGPFVITRRGRVRLELRWQAGDADLDLHAWLADGTHVSYRSPDAVAPRVVLLEDILGPPGPEVLVIDGTDRVDVFVHAFSSHPVARVGAALRIVTDHNPEGDIITPSMDSGDATWFSACTVFSDRIEVTGS